MKVKNRNSRMRNYVSEIKDNWFALLLLGGLFIYGISSIKPEKWLGFYYPEGNFVSNTIYSPEFNSKEECVRWAENTRTSRPSDHQIERQNLYECGKSCKLEHAGTRLYICEETYDGGNI